MTDKHSIKWLALLLAFCLIWTMPAAAFAEELDGAADASAETEELPQLIMARLMTVPIACDRYNKAAEEVLALVNVQRAAAGLQPLTIDSRLQEAAMKRAAESIVYFEHTRPDGTGCWTAEPELMIGENLAAGQNSPQQVMNSWMNSAGHRANILQPSYQSIGVGCVYYNGIWYWCQTFGTAEADGILPEASVSAHVENISILPSLVKPIWAGETELDLGEKLTAEALQVLLYGVNQGWDYAVYQLPANLFTLTSSDETVLKVDSEGTLTPVSVGTAEITAVLKADTSCTISQEIHVMRTLKDSDVKLSRTSYTYNGKAKKPTVTVEGLTKDDYVVSYKNNVKVGTATVTITGVGDVEGTIKKTFKINYDRPGRVQLKKPTTGKTHYVKALWYDMDCDGYQIRYATNSSFKNSKSIYVKDGDQVSRTIKSLTKGKRYYVKVRAYNNYQDTKVFGKWSLWKSVVCK